jgi:hypothetical protein
VTVVDTIAVLPHVLWDDPEEAEALGEWIEAHALPDEGTEQVRWSYDWTLMELDDPPDWRMDRGTRPT